ncbi:hypothetical protein FRP1_28860 (plasmid) [Pseudonocardia sp. EC080625-04]|uniref:hypothetical protein n=1 Tax=Pseudonocardia sp. EC080625-04 TaxID=1096868 RepID=UPI0006CB7A25|nr:hypothetical protein [Pseudonocardia sp. EC080625-04]ALE76807.1 hypothetical protein FRP1_28860 [Pseudonocardia sp. EC080625-04]
MSLHIEWDTASVEVRLLPAEQGLDELHPDAGIDSSHVLVLGGAGGGALAIEGDLDALADIGHQIGDAVREARKVEG